MLGAHTNTTANATKAVHDFAAAERVHKIATALHKMDRTPADVVRVGMAAARDRHPRVMAVLEQTAEAIRAGIDAQMGESIRTKSLGYHYTWEPTEAGAWRSAYEEADKGDPGEQFMFFYAAAAHVAGLAPFDDRTRRAVKKYLGA